MSNHKNRKRNSNRPYSEDLLLQIKEQNIKLLENQKTIKVTLNQILLKLEDVKTTMEINTNISWIAQQLKEQGHIK